MLTWDGSSWESSCKDESETGLSVDWLKAASRLISRGCKLSYTAVVCMELTRLEFSGNGAERGNRVGIIRTAKNRRPRDQDVGTGLEDLGGVLDFDAAVHFEQGLAAGPVDELSGSPQFIQTGGDKGLSPEPGIDRHDQHQVHVRDDFFEGVLKEVDGLSVTPALTPCSLMLWMVRCRWGQVSVCTVR